MHHHQSSEEHDDDDHDDDDHDKRHHHHSKASTTCSYIFHRISNNICQIRLDFNILETAKPAITGAAGTIGTCSSNTIHGDSVTFKSPTGSSPPVVCGILTGQHMYLETGTMGNAGTATFDFGSVASSKTFKVKVTYFNCNSNDRLKAPPGCVQYFTGISGEIESYNFQGGTLLDHQNYQTCIRQAEGFCSILYTFDAQTTPNAFSLFQSSGAGVTDPCIGSFVMVPDTVSLPAGINTDRFCGPLENLLVPFTIVGGLAPFQLGTVSHFAKVLPALTAASTGATGYNIDYTQVPCN
jgi:hypothetical protein